MKRPFTNVASLDPPSRRVRYREPTAAFPAAPIAYRGRGYVVAVSGQGALGTYYGHHLTAFARPRDA